MNVCRKQKYRFIHFGGRIFIGAYMLSIVYSSNLRYILKPNIMTIASWTTKTDDSLIFQIMIPSGYINDNQLMTFNNNKRNDEIANNETL